MSDRDAAHTLSELQEARAEIDRLREIMRWRKWPEEKPPTEGDYLCCDEGRIFLGSFQDGVWFEDYGPDVLFTKIEHWRPIGPLPCEGGE